MIIESGQQGCAREVLVIAAALSIQDPRERPTDNQQAADTAHRRFAQPESDFLAFVALWDYLADRQRELSGSAFRRLCRAEFLNYLRVREWQDLHGQLASPHPRSRDQHQDIVFRTGRGFIPPCSPDCLSHVGMKVVLTPARPPLAGRRPGAPSAAAVRCPSTSAPAAPGSRSSPAPASPASRRTGSSPPSSSRRPGSGPDRRGDRARMGRAGRRPPGQALLQRAPLVTEPRRRRRHREGHPLRHPDRRRPDRELLHRIDPVARPRAVHQARPRRGRLADQAPLLPRQRQAASRKPPNSSSAPAAAAWSPGEDALFEFYDARVPADVTSARHFDAWWKRHATRPLTCSRSPRRPARAEAAER